MSTDHAAALLLQLESQSFNRELKFSRTLMKTLGDEGNSLTATLKQTGVAMGSLFVGNKMVRGFQSAILAASAYREDLAQFDHVMRNVTKSANDMVASLTSDAYGRSSMQARQMLMGLTSLAKGMGMTDKSAVELSGGFAKMAIDIGSFMAVDPERVISAFQSALMGNSLALRSYNVFISEALLKNTMAANAKKGLVFATEREARAYALLTEAQRQQSDAIGDYAIEAANFGNQLKQLKNGLSELPAKFGAGLLAPANEVLKKVNKVIDAMQKWDDATWKNILTFTALGTAAGLAFGSYKIGAVAVAFYTKAKHASTAAAGAKTAALGKQSVASGIATAAINAETAALTANTAAKKVNAVSGVGAGIIKGKKVNEPNKELARHQKALFREDKKISQLDAQRKFLAKEYAAANILGMKKEAKQYKAKFLETNLQYNDEKYSMINSMHTQKFKNRNLISTMTLSDHNAMLALGGFGATSDWRDGSAWRAGRKRTHDPGFLSISSDSHGLSKRGKAYLTATKIKAIGRRKKWEGRKKRWENIYNMPTTMLKKTGRGVKGVAGKIPGASVIGNIIKSLGSTIYKLSPGFFSKVGIIALKSLNPAGWLTATMLGLGAVGNYLPTIMNKAWDAFESAFTIENMKKIWNKFSTGVSSGVSSSFASVRNYTAKGLSGLYNAAGSVGVTSYNLLFGTNYKSTMRQQYEAQQQVARAEEALNQIHEEQAKREKQIVEFKTKVSDQEREWLDKEEALLKKRSEMALNRFDATSKAEMLSMTSPMMENLIDSIDMSMHQVAKQLKQSEFGYIKAVQSGQSEEIISKALDHYHAMQARYNDFVNQRGKYQTQAIEQRYELFDSRFEQIGQMKTSSEKLGGYGNLLSQLRNDSILKRQEQIYNEFASLNSILMEKEAQYNHLKSKGYTEQAEKIKEEIELAEKRVLQAESDYNELQANLSAQRKIEEQLEALKEEQMRKHKEAQKSLWSFRFDHVDKSQQQKMVRNEFFKAQNRFEGASTETDKMQALQEMQDMYSKLEKEVMPVWRGFSRSTASAIDSDSSQAQDLQERILNDFDKSMLDTAKQQLVITKVLHEALMQIERNTHPSYQSDPVGGAVW